MDRARSPSKRKTAIPDEEPFFAAVRKGDLFTIQNAATPFYRQKPEKQQLSDGTTPLHHAAEKCDKTAYAVLIHLNKKHVSQGDKNGNTPLHFAAKFGNTDGVHMLIQNGAKVNARNKDDMGAIHIAATQGNEEIIKALVECGVGIDSTDGLGRTPLHITIQKGHTQLIRTLVRLKADPDLTTDNAENALDLALKAKDFDTVTLLINNGANVEVLYSSPNKSLMEFCAHENPTGVPDSLGFFPSRGYTSFNEKPVIKGAKKFNKRLAKYDKNAIRASKDRISKLLKACIKGSLPNAQRAAWWRLCLGDLSAARSEYNDYVKKKLDNAEGIQIDKDINRCLRYHRDYAERYADPQCKLYRILKAYALFNRETKYTQGMSTLAAILLIYFPDEAECYTALRIIFLNYNMGEWYGNNLAGLTKSFPKFEAIVQAKLPNLHNHLKRHIANSGIEHYSSLFLTNWILELFYSSLPFSVVLQCWDCFLLMGPHFIFSIGIAILSTIQNQLMALTDVGSLITALKNTEGLPFTGANLLKRAQLFKLLPSAIQ